MANRVGTGGGLAYRSPLFHAGSAAVLPAQIHEGGNDEGASVHAAPRVPVPAFASVESARGPRKLVSRVTTVLTGQEEGLTVPEMCDRLDETSDAVRAALATLLLSGRVR